LRQSPAIKRAGQSTQNSILTCDPIHTESCMLLVGSSGTVHVWDVRSPSLSQIADLAGTPNLAAAWPGSCVTAVDVASTSAAIVCGQPSAIHWLDLRVGHTVQAWPHLLWPSVFGRAVVEEAPVRVASARQGFVAAWFDAPMAPVACYLGGGPALAPLCAGPSAGTATAVARSFGNAASALPPSVIGLARPSRKKLIFEICAFGASMPPKVVHGGKCAGAVGQRSERKVSDVCISDSVPNMQRRRTRDGPGRKTLAEGRKTYSRRHRGAP